ncbi:uncharacterized protein NECHADRAFT_88370 [Fusarium vanettenii 77-13-4]|uniref:DUF6570 domain-containing protein n=1 Tax=Fusarium vanettenii (strain ATCC MYA-4622 / CBS 123669 / FGSC 9596 / NRRL 45880 / 77-13-4) TaxID=660122 RepID=C7ZM91_FUSV7|nr:uncharacterized protein NECHADRAFT_88370 [Fusarium vanettenii 77-13-4]EEU34852.1 hypothetical protein NECHADRAFT_88370 [Fusarium vanettenii 77-13-4]
MEDDIPQAVRNCRTCKQDLPEVEFRGVKDPTKFTGQCSSCRARQKERATESRAAVAAMRNIVSGLSPRRTAKRTDSQAHLTPPRRNAPAPVSINSSQPPATPAVFRGLAPVLQGLPRPLLDPSTSSVVEGVLPIPPTPSPPRVVLGTPIPSDTAPTAPIVLGTPVPQESFPTTASLLPQGHRRGRYTRQGIVNRRPRPQLQERQFDQIVDPPFTGDLDLPTLSEEDQALVREFYTALNDDKMHSCIRCREHWFDMKKNSLGVCSRCISRDRERTPDEPYFFSAANSLDFGEVPGSLPSLTMVEEMLIARVHYKYRGHVAHFLRNVGRLFEELPVLPEELDIVLLRPPDMEGDPHFQQQFARDFRRHHPGYRDIVVRQDRLQRLPLDGSIVASVASQVADIPDGEAPQGPVEEDVEEDPVDVDASAIPNLQVTDTELNALQSRFLYGTPDPERMADLEYIPPNAQTQHQIPLPSIRRPGLFVTEWKAAPEAARMALSRQLLRDNAYIAAYHFHKRYMLFRTIVLKQKFNLIDFWGRYEWGERNNSQMNHYNRLLAVAWLANTDMSPCMSLQQVIDYVAKYCSKSEKKIAERDYSKQEVSYLLLGLPLQEGSRTCLQIDCRNPDMHSRFLRIDADEVDEAPNVYEKYCQRPEALEDLTNPSKWKQWQPGNVNGRPRVLVYFPRY